MGSSDSQQSSSTVPRVPRYLNPYYENTAKGLESAQGSLPSIQDLFSQIPELNIANLTGAETGIIGQYENLGNQYGASGGANPLQSLAGQGFGNFIDQGGGPSAATQAAEKNFSDFQSPQIQQSANLAGLGTSGAGLEAQAAGAEQALVPFLTADEQNQLSASQGLGQLGGMEFGQQQTALASALQAAGMPRDVANQQAQALFNQQQQREQFGQQVQMGGMSQFPSLIGGGSSTSVSTPGKF